jgi:apolipoprotein N-acyltransferase
MNRVRRFMKEHAPTSGEKALAVMFLAGMLGLWAGSNLSGPSEAAGMNAAAVAMVQAKVGPALRRDVQTQRAQEDAPVASDLPSKDETNAPEPGPVTPPLF